MIVLRKKDLWNYVEFWLVEEQATLDLPMHICSAWLVMVYSVVYAKVHLDSQLISSFMTCI